MADHTPTQHPPAAAPHESRESVEQHPEQHEQSDISIKSVVIFFASFITFAIVVHVGLFFLYAGFDRAEGDKKEEISAVSASAPRASIPLQGIPGVHAPSPAEDTRTFLAQQKTHLESSGPTTQPGYVRIPISQAMELVVERQMLPVRQPATREAQGDAQ